MALLLIFKSNPLVFPFLYIAGSRNFNLYSEADSKLVKLVAMTNLLFNEHALQKSNLTVKGASPIKQIETSEIKVFIHSIG